MKEIKEGKAVMHFPETNEVFYNPVQVFNRDLSINVITTYIQSIQAERQALAQQRAAKTHSQQAQQERPRGDKGKQSEEGSGDDDDHDDGDGGNGGGGDRDKAKEGGVGGVSQGVSLLEALSATGLRSIRYFKEIPGLSSIVANDVSPSAVAAIRRNVEQNGLDPASQIIPNEADASLFMYMNNPSIPGKKGFTIIDLDPYGSAVPFLDSAMHCIQEGGLMCVTCTDMAVLSGAHGDACWSKYGAMPLNTAFCHESALRILLRCLEGHANKQRKYIVPLLSCSIDFYVRVFIRVHSSPMIVKRSPSKHCYFYTCRGCGSFHLQPVGTRFEQGNRKKYTPGIGPTIPQQCVECGRDHYMGGPVWSDPIHDQAFVAKLLENIKKSSEQDFATHQRMLGMVSVISEELPDAPFYYDLPEVAKRIRCITPGMVPLRSAILSRNYRTSSTHCNMTAVKTDAPPHVMWDIMRSWVKLRPVKLKNFEEGAVGRVILEKEPKFEADFTERPEADPPSRKFKLVRFPEKPENWGPMARAKSHGKGNAKEEMIKRRTENQGKTQAAKKARLEGEQDEEMPREDKQEDTDDKE